MIPASLNIPKVAVLPVSATRILAAAAFVLLCLWTGSSPATLKGQIGMDGFDIRCLPA